MRPLKRNPKFLLALVALLPFFANVSPVSAGVQTVTITFLTTTHTGNITFAGTTYYDKQIGNYPNGTSYTATAGSPKNANFTGWSSTGGLRIIDPSLKTTSVVVTGTGTLTANFGPYGIQPLTIVIFSIAVCAVALVRGRRAKLSRAVVATKRFAAETTNSVPQLYDA